MSKYGTKKQRDSLLRFQNAIAGKNISNAMAQDINSLLGYDAYDAYNNKKQKLTPFHRVKLSDYIRYMTTCGIRPSKDLLTPHQRKALGRKP